MAISGVLYVFCKNSATLYNGICTTHSFLAYVDGATYFSFVLRSGRSLGGQDLRDMGTLGRGCSFVV